MFGLGIKLFYSGVNSFESDVNPASGQVDREFIVVYMNEEKVYCRKEMPMTAFLCVRAETQTSCTGLGRLPLFAWE